MIHMIFDTAQGKNNFTIFSPPHIVILLTTIIFVFILFKIHKQSKTFEITSCLILIVDQICLYIWYYFGLESFIKKGLPLYSCRMAVVLIILGILFNKNILLKIGSYWGVFGSIIGLLFPTMTLYKYTFPHITHISFALLHIFLLLMSLYILFIKKIVMTKKDFKICINFTIIYHIFTFIFNIIVGSNYAYTTRLPSNIKFTVHPIICLFLVILLFVVMIFLEYKVINRITLNLEYLNIYIKCKNKYLYKDNINTKSHNEDK